MFLFRDKLRSLRWLFAEVVVVVLGILIAFQIDEWKTQRQERRQEIVSLEAISGDLELGLEELRLYEEMANRAYAQLARVVRILQDGLEVPDEFPDLDPEVIFLALTQRPNDRLWRPTATAFDSLRDTGNLNLVSDHELRSELVDYHDTYEPYFLDIRLSASEARSRYTDILDKDFDLVPGPNFEAEPAPSRRLRVPLEDWPTDPDFQNVLIRYAERLHFARGIASDMQGTVTELQNRIADHIESIR